MLQIDIEKTKRYYNINSQISLNNLTLVMDFLPLKMIRFFHKYV
ncbi:hypothetical protein CaldiYA01_03290 [Caldicellulosiruptor diazotrophicus]|uniref:Uncharacterized protein n=1 Tax=Caldicellulosiruptor diazotrophicus TaxID=2806205 RepID=A0ABN6E5E3_9FIRM|nr:hypothetical protein CaldiYA01_03290 [Caldicellulosiruptor diazotrophicus]